MNSYQNKKRKRNLAKKAKRQHTLYAKKQEEFFNSLSWFKSVEYKKLSEIIFEERFVFGNDYSIVNCIFQAARQGVITLSEEGIKTLFPKAIDNLPEYKFTEEQLEILKRRATN